MREASGALTAAQAHLGSDRNLDDEQTKFEAMDILNKYDIPCGPILSMKEIAEEPSLRATGTVVEVDHPTRGKFLTVGNPIKMSEHVSEVKRSPLLGEHNEEVLRDVLKFDDATVRRMLASPGLGGSVKAAAEIVERRARSSIEHLPRQYPRQCWALCA